MDNKIVKITLGAVGFIVAIILGEIALLLFTVLTSEKSTSELGHQSNPIVQSVQEEQKDTIKDFDNSHWNIFNSPYPNYFSFEYSKNWNCVDVKDETYEGWAPYQVLVRCFDKQISQNKKEDALLAPVISALEIRRNTVGIEDELVSLIKSDVTTTYYSENVVLSELPAVEFVSGGEFAQYHIVAGHVMTMYDELVFDAESKEALTNDQKHVISTFQFTE